MNPRTPLEIRAARRTISDGNGEHTPSDFVSESDGEDDTSEDFNVVDASNVVATADDGEPEIEEGDLFPLDPALPALHAYLGECADLSNTFGMCLEDGHECLLPVLSLTDLVVTPGCTLPLLVCNSRAHWVLEQALSAADPYKGLIAVVMKEEHQERDPVQRRVGCTAGIKKVQRHDNGIWPATLKVLAEGCQRLEVVQATTQLSWRVRICADVFTRRLPKEAQEGMAYWAPWAWRASDAWALTAEAARLFKELFPDVKVLQGDPVEVSYWMTRNIPLSASTRQELLGWPTVVHRLRSICSILKAEACSHLLCRVCHCQLAHNKDVLEVSDEGIGGLFVNPSGYVHDIVAIRHIAPEKLMLLGRPSQEHSWFPGYAWTIANCGACGQHLGWRFTALQHQSPRHFLGLRSQALTSARILGTPEDVHVAGGKIWDKVPMSKALPQAFAKQIGGSQRNFRPLAFHDTHQRDPCKSIPRKCITCLRRARSDR